MTRITVPDKATPIKAPEYSHNTSRFNGRVPEYSIDQSLPAEDFAKNNGDDLSATWHKLLKPHVNSFNWFTKTGLTLLPKSVLPQAWLFNETEDQRFEIGIEKVTLDKPKVHSKIASLCKNKNVYPAECRQRKSTYGSNLHVQIYFKTWKGDNQKNCIENSINLEFSEIPIMVGSNLCHLSTCDPYQKIVRGEESREAGGFFVCNGNEKVIRMLCLPRRNIPIAMSRKSYIRRGNNFTEFGSSIRSVSKGLFTKNIVVHYLKGGDCKVQIYYKNIPLIISVNTILIALTERGATPSMLIDEIIRGQEHNLFLASRARAWLTESVQQNEYTGRIARAQLGKKLRGLINNKSDGLPSWWTFEEFGQYVIDTCVLPHLDNNTDKLRLMCVMIRQAFGLGTRELTPENADSTANHEVLLPGHLIQAVLTDRLETLLTQVRYNIIRKSTTLTSEEIMTDDWLRKLSKVMDPARPVHYLMATGNLKTSSQSLLGLQQASGLAVVADRLNAARFLSHFRCIHRGSFFQQMRTTEARKLLPESWGFICPIHTPDGGACGLLQHIASLCEVTQWEITEIERNSILQLCQALGMRTVENCDSLGTPSSRSLPVVFDGKLIGWLPASLAKRAECTLRVFKTLGKQNIPKNMEVVYRPLPSEADKLDHTRIPSPGIFLLTEPARLIRPIYNLRTESVEMVGSLEQIWLKVNLQTKDAIDDTLPDELLKHFHGPYTHQEVSIQAFLSALATMTPFSDMNQSARNMYQCQMLKQTMGTAAQALQHRADTKMYRMQTGQSPLDRCYHYDHYGFDEYPTGVNSVVAVISYTGEDMEDAMILNKSAVERGFHYGSVYATKFVDLVEGMGVGKGRGRFSEQCPLTFGFLPGSQMLTKMSTYLNKDGLPFVGRILRQGDPYYCTRNHDTGKEVVTNWKEKYEATVENIRAVGNETGQKTFVKVAMTLRIRRPPTVGDKFAARHGQKGTCSRLWNVENLPFTESGLVPDIIFNPHGFPTRMTVGMMVEAVAGKAAALHGECYDTSPFVFDEENRASDYFGEVLQQAGYEFYGRERMFSGTSGDLLNADIFIGCIYYQRLRHMVEDKAQVRVSGPVDQLTQQPVKGRRRGGGMRMGEMERDALIAHGATAVLNDRWMECSDATQGYICSKCHSLISTYNEKPGEYEAAAMKVNEMSHLEKTNRTQVVCRVCGPSSEIRRVNVPFVLRYLVAEMAAMNIKLEFQTTPAACY